MSVGSAIWPLDRTVSDLDGVGCPTGAAPERPSERRSPNGWSETSGFQDQRLVSPLDSVRHVSVSQASSTGHGARAIGAGDRSRLAVCEARTVQPPAGSAEATPRHAAPFSLLQSAPPRVSAGPR